MKARACLDIEQAVSVAPGLKQLRVYIGPTKFGTGVDGYIFSKMATDNAAKQLSNSWWWSPDDPATDDPYFEEMAVQGQTFFSISGDKGAYIHEDRVDQGYPAEDVHLTVVGGTALTTNGAGGSWASEVAWNDYQEGSGGGPANDGTTYFSIPSWQQPVINSSNDGSTAVRNSPDVALQADFDNYICYDNGKCSTDWGGTSFASPRWAAWFALVNQELVANGSPAGLGFINPTLYSIAQSSRYATDFHDIVSGNNDTNGQPVFYYAVPGYDLVTGWGSMNGASLLEAFLTYKLAVSLSGSGTVTSTDGFINCPGTCSHIYPGQTTVTLNATPAAGWTFAGWSGACTGTGSCNLTMSQNQSVTATFTQNHLPAIRDHHRQRHRDQHRRLHQLPRHLFPHLSFQHASHAERDPGSGLELHRMERRLQRHRLLPADDDAESVRVRHLHPGLLHADGIGRRQRHRHQHRRLHQLPGYVFAHIYFSDPGHAERHACLGLDASAAGPAPAWASAPAR